MYKLVEYYKAGNCTEVWEVLSELSSSEIIKNLEIIDLILHEAMLRIEKNLCIVLNILEKYNYTFSYSGASFGKQRKLDTSIKRNNSKDIDNFFEYLGNENLYVGRDLFQYFKYVGETNFVGFFPPNIQNYLEPLDALLIESIEVISMMVNYIDNKEVIFFSPDSFQKENISGSTGYFFNANTTVQIFTTINGVNISMIDYIREQLNWCCLLGLKENKTLPNVINIMLEDCRKQLISF